MQKLVLLRHGESLWNQENRFTGWTDIDLSDFGVRQAENAGQLLKEKGFMFDVAFTSVLKRAVKTLNLVLDNMDMHWLPVQKSWRLNERFYGALQGRNKLEAAAEFGQEKVQLWRRDVHALPPAITADDIRFPKDYLRYDDLSYRELPLTENLEETMLRLLPCWHESVVPALRQGKRVIICAHGNSLRALIKYIENMSDEAVALLEVPTGVPWIYELDEQLNYVSRFELQR